MTSNNIAELEPFVGEPLWVSAKVLGGPCYIRILDIIGNKVVFRFIEYKYIGAYQYDPEDTRPSFYKERFNSDKFVMTLSADRIHLLEPLEIFTDDDIYDLLCGSDEIYHRGYDEDHADPDLYEDEE